MYDWAEIIGVVIAVVVAVAGAWLIGVIASLVLRPIAKRATWPALLVRYTNMPFRVVVGVVLLWIGLAVVAFEDSWYSAVLHGGLVAFIIALTWLGTGFVSFGFLTAEGRYDLDAADNRLARKAHTQLRVLRQVVVVLVWMLGVGAALLTFPAVQAFGASLLASAGIASIVAGIAAQSLLANIFAGMQIALSDAIRVDDVVVAGGEWGRIEDITLTYVVLHVWDDRRLVLPSTYFTTTPFENWTRRDSAILGSVMFDVDWSISPSAMRDELQRILAESELWDGRVGNVQVTDATGGVIQVRVLVSAADAGRLWDLRCSVREHLVEWVRRQREGMPRTRVEIVEGLASPGRKRPATRDEDGVFTGSAEASARGEQFRASESEKQEPTGR